MKVCIIGETTIAEALGAHLAQTEGFTVVAHSIAADYVVEFLRSEHLGIDGVDCPLEQRLAANLEDLNAQHPGLGSFQLFRAGGIRKP